ncbi:MAG: phosphate signaling complex protein PhoU [Anaerovoracaceae bacterium]
MRNKFDEQLAILNVELIKMGSLCELAISNVIAGLIDDNDELLNIAIETEVEIDQKEREIENQCLKLLLQQQPVAKDLRTISSALKMISDMERIGDQAADIAEITKYIEGDDSKNKTHLKDMASATIQMVTDSIQSFVDKDLELAYSVMKYDDIVDAHFDEIKNEIIELISANKANGESCLDLLMIAKYFERIGDHAVNIAEWVEFSITGQRSNNE